MTTLKTQKDKTTQFLHTNNLWYPSATCERSTPNLLLWSLIQPELLPRSHTFQLFQTPPYESISLVQLTQALRTSQNKGWAQSTFLSSQQLQPGLYFQPGGLSKTRRSSLHLFSPYHIKHKLIASAFKVSGHALPPPSYLVYDWGVISHFWCRYDTNFYCVSFQLHIFMLSPQPLHRRGQLSKSYHWIVPASSSPAGREVPKVNQTSLSQGNPAASDQMSQTAAPGDTI